MWSPSFTRTHKFRHDSLRALLASSIVLSVLSPRRTTTRISLPNNGLFHSIRRHFEKRNKWNVKKITRQDSIIDRFFYFYTWQIVSRASNVKFSSNRPDFFNVWGRLWRDIGDDARAGQDITESGEKGGRQNGRRETRHPGTVAGRGTRGRGYRRATSGGERENRER